MKVALASVFLVAVLAFAAPRQQSSGGNVDHGRYIVEHVAKCIECHTPRDGNGALLLSQLLMGAPIPVQSPYPGLRFAASAPRIAGLPGYTDEEGVRLLSDGINRHGFRPQPPMPQFGMSREDARDVVAFLKSLP